MCAGCAGVGGLAPVPHQCAKCAHDVHTHVGNSNHRSDNNNTSYESHETCDVGTDGEATCDDVIAGLTPNVVRVEPYMDDDD